jgi:serine/threonine protein kinase
VDAVTAATDSQSRGEWYCSTCEQSFPVGEYCPNDGARLVRLKPRVDPFVGRDLDGRYTIVQKLGQGGMGAVYRAQQHSVGREVAVKVVNADLVAEPEVIKRFLREAKLASMLSHPNAVAVLDFGQTDDGVFYLVMELVSGRTLDAVLDDEKVLRPERVVRIGSQILSALEGAHALSIIHRDLKPSNVMLLAHGRDLVKVLDFGLAKSVSPDATSATMTGTGAIIGTPAFMPPELATGAPCDARADLYSLGCILYVMGTGRLPFQSTSAHEMIAMHGSRDPAPPMTGVPTRLAQVVAKLLEKDPARRFQTASEALDALESSLASPVSVASRADLPLRPSTAALLQTETDFASVPITTPPVTSAPRRRWPLLAVSVGALATGAAVLAVLGTRGHRDDAPAERTNTPAATSSPSHGPSVTPVLDEPGQQPAPPLDATVEPANEDGHAPSVEPRVEPAGSPSVERPVEPQIERPVERVEDPTPGSTKTKSPRTTRPPRTIPRTGKHTDTTTEPATTQEGSASKPASLPF